MAEDIVKSVGRVFEVLELFGSSRQPLNATQIERLLNYPQSSTLALLKSLVKLGYLSFDRIEHSYFPTMRFANLGRWLKADSSGDQRLLATLGDISLATGQTVVLACQNDLQMQWVQIWRGRYPLAETMVMGDSAPLFSSTLGQVSLSAMPDAHIARLAHRFDRSRSHQNVPVELQTLMTNIRTIRERGYGLGWNEEGSGNAVIAWPWSAGATGRVMAFAVIGEIQIVEKTCDDIVRTVEAALHAVA